MKNAHARILAHLNHWNMTTTTETTATETETEASKDHAFLGLYVRKDLKAKIAAAAKAEERSMSKFASRIFEKHLANA